MFFECTCQMPQEEKFQDRATCRASQHKPQLKATVWILVAACGYCGLVSGALVVMVLMWCWSMTDRYTANDPAAEWDLFFVTWGKRRKVVRDS